jgi:predicted RNA-binding protein Jag
VEEIERSAGSVEEAVEAALQDLGISEQEAVIEIVQ